METIHPTGVPTPRTFVQTSLVHLPIWRRVACATRFFKVAAAAALCSFAPCELRAIEVNSPGYSATAYYTSSDAIVAFNWGADGGLYFTRGFWEGGFYSYKNGQESLVTTHDGFGGDSVAVHGNYIYYNWSSYGNDQYIQRYDVTTGVDLRVSSAPNYGLTMHNGTLFITGAEGFGPNSLFYTGLNPDGSFASNPPISFAQTGGASGPLAFASNGDAYYAPGYSDNSVYYWSASEVAAALADPLGSPLTIANSLFVDLDSIFTFAYDGSSAMAITDDGEVYLTLTSFLGESYLVRLTQDGAGEVILSSNERLGDIRMHEGSLYVASGDTIYQVIPEPGVASLLAISGLFGYGVLAWQRRRNRA